MGDTMRHRRASKGMRAYALRTCAVALALSVSHAQDPQPPASVPLPAGASDWELIFNDEFEGSTYNTGYWNPYADWGGNNSFNAGRERYYPSQIRLADGICHLVAEPDTTVETFEGSYRSGELISARASPLAGNPYKVSFLYGYIEARIKIVNVSGFFGAFWLLPCKENYVYEWEIDILEVLGHDPQTMFQTYHYRPGLVADLSRNASWSPNRGTGNNGNAPAIDYSGDFHTFGLDWQPDRLAFYIDGIESGSFPTPGDNFENIPRTPGYILIQHMVENSWIRATDRLLPDPKTSVDTFHIDYVRVWQATSESAMREAGAAPRPHTGELRYTRVSREQMVFETPAAATLLLFDMRGSIVTELRPQPGSRHAVWNTRTIPAGAYFVLPRHEGNPAAPIRVIRR